MMSSENQAKSSSSDESILQMPPAQAAADEVSAIFDNDDDDDGEELIDLMDFHNNAEDDDEAEYVPQELLEYVQEVGDRLLAEKQGFFKTLHSNSNNTQGAEKGYVLQQETLFSPDQWISPPARRNPVDGMTESQVKRIALEGITPTPNVSQLHPSTSPTEPTELFASSPELSVQMQVTRSQESLSSPPILHIGDVDETYIVEDDEMVSTQVRLTSDTETTVDGITAAENILVAKYQQQEVKLEPMAPVSPKHTHHQSGENSYHNVSSSKESLSNMEMPSANESEEGQPVSNPVSTNVNHPLSPVVKASPAVGKNSPFPELLEDVVEKPRVPSPHLSENLTHLMESPIISNELARQEPTTTNYGSDLISEISTECEEQTHEYLAPDQVDDLVFSPAQTHKQNSPAEAKKSARSFLERLTQTIAPSDSIDSERLNDDLQAQPLLSQQAPDHLLETEATEPLDILEPLSPDMHQDEVESPQLSVRPANPSGVMKDEPSAMQNRETSSNINNPSESPSLGPEGNKGVPAPIDAIFSPNVTQKAASSKNGATMEQFLASKEEQVSPIQKVSSPITQNVVSSTSLSPTTASRSNRLDSKTATQPGRRTRATGSMVPAPRAIPRPMLPKAVRAPGNKATPASQSTTDAVALAKERIRQKKLKDKVQQGKENDHKMNVKIPSTRSTFGASSRPPRKSTLNNATKSTLKETTYIKRNRLSEMTMAQGAEYLQRNLRSSSAANSGEPRTLTVPVSPKFVMTVKYGEKMLSASCQKKDSPTLAQSGDVLARGLREPSLAFGTKRKSKNTLPITPKFHTTSRRKVLPKSTAENEKEKTELRAQLKKEPPSKPVARVPTKPVPFRLHASKRPVKHQAANEHVESRNGFKALPMPNFDKKAVALPARARTSKPAPTEPKPFRLSLSRRTRCDIEAEEAAAKAAARKVAEAKPFKAQPLPKTTYHPQLVRSPETPSPTGIATSAQPFEFESSRRHEIYQTRLQEKLKEQEEQERVQRKFHAREFKRPPPPEPKIKSEKAPTEPAPFRLVYVDRHVVSAEKLKEKLEVEEEESRRQSLFKASPVPKSTYEASIFPTQQMKALEEERLQKLAIQEEERRIQATFKAKPVPRTTYEYVPLSPKNAQVTVSEATKNADML